MKTKTISTPICTCGHTGSAESSQHMGLLGHGYCKVCKAACPQFTWHHNAYAHAHKTNLDVDVCLSCKSPSIIGAPDCKNCGAATDKCASCGAWQHECKVTL